MSNGYEVGSMTVTKYSPRSQCHGKVPYQNEGVAISSITANHGIWTEEYDAYECPHCSKWHIGHKPELRRSRIGN
jgi:hypothetical protein